MRFQIGVALTVEVREAGGEERACSGKAGACSNFPETDPAELRRHSKTKHTTRLMTPKGSADCNSDVFTRGDNLIDFAFSAQLL